MATSKQKLKIYDLESNLFAEFWRGIKLGLTNLWRNRLLSLATILVMSIMVCIFNSILAVNFISRQALTNLNQKVDLVLYLKDGTDYYDANQLVGQIRDLPGVKTVQYISKAQALQLISKTYPETSDFLTKFNLRNPLPASISVTTNSAEDQQGIFQFLAKSPLNQFIDDSNNQNRTTDQEILSSTTQNLVNINNFVKQLIFWVVFIFIIGGALIVINAIQLTIFTRRNEIFVMRLVGATPNFIRLPFLTEGICYAIFSVSMSFLLMFLAGKTLGLENLQLLKDLSNINLANIFLSELGLAVLLSLFSSLVTVEQYLHGQLSYN